MGVYLQLEPEHSKYLRGQVELWLERSIEAAWSARDEERTLLTQFPEDDRFRKRFLERFPEEEEEEPETGEGRGEETE